jgi:hypothetical protein
MSALEQTNSLRFSQNTGQYLRIEQSNLMAMSLAGLNSLIYEIESSELFNIIFREEHIIRYKKFDRTDISPRYLSIDESKVANNQSPEIESLLVKNSNIIEIIRKIGIEKFKCYFLLPEEGLSVNEIADACGVSISCVEGINNLVNDMTVIDEFNSKSSLNVNTINYTKAAEVEIDRIGFKINYYTKSLAAGRYVIDYEMFEDYAAKKGLSKKEITNIRVLFKKLETINICKSTLHLILVNLIEKQSAYIESGNCRDLLPLSQKEMALKIGVHPGTFCRAIKDRTIVIPCGREITLKSLFPNPRKFRMRIVKEVMQSESNTVSDAAISLMLAEKHGVNISRRTIADIRRELRIPAGRDR